jgi:Holliday junction resolvasome RuvABC endonuclease subunit
MSAGVIGLDLAAERSGIAYPDGTTAAILAPKIKGARKRTLADDLARLDHIAAYVTDVLAHHETRLAVIEDYAPGIRSAAAHRLAEISGAVRLACWRAGVPVALVNVMHLKIYATGSGGATKSQMATSAQARAGLVFPTEDECDAWWLRAMGLDAVGQPVIDLPKLHRGALAKVTWPEMAVAS